MIISYKYDICDDDEEEIVTFSGTNRCVYAVPLIEHMGIGTC